MAPITREISVDTIPPSHVEIQIESLLETNHADYLHNESYGGKLPLEKITLPFWKMSSAQSNWVPMNSGKKNHAENQVKTWSFARFTFEVLN